MHPAEHAIAAQTLSDCQLRANPTYELVSADALSKNELDQLGECIHESSFFGVLRPRPESGAALKAICKDTAALFRWFQAPQCCPLGVRNTIGPDWPQALLRLLADEILEAELRGRFNTGPVAVSQIVPDVQTQLETRVQRLSIEAIRLAQSWPGVAPSELSLQMYFYNRAPVTPQLRRAAAATHSLEQWLRIGAADPVSRLLRQHWHRRPGQKELRGWLYWDRQASLSQQKKYKLYISPTLDCFNTVFSIVIGFLALYPHLGFKISDSISGLCRPDKFVIYFESWTDLEESGSQLSRYLDGYPAQGVPFSSPLRSDGMLSWGIDPPADASMLSDERGVSWRMLLTNRLAAALLAARQAPGCASEPWLYALLRLRIDGIDTDRWAYRTQSPALADTK